MKKMVAVATILGGGLAVMGAVLQKTGKLSKFWTGKAGTARVIRKTNRPVAVFGVKQVFPETTPGLFRKVGTAAFSAGAAYLYHHRKK